MHVDIAFATLQLAGTPIGTMSVLWLYLLVLFTLVAVGSLKLFRRGPTLSTAEVSRLQRHRQVGPFSIRFALGLKPKGPWFLTSQPVSHISICSIGGADNFGQ
jgi:hypothetical protein